MIDISTPVLVLSSGHHGALGIVRSLGRLGISVYVVSASSSAPHVRSKYCRGAFLWDIEAAPAADSLEYLTGVGSRLGSTAILMGTSNAAALFLACHGGELRSSFTFSSQSPDLVRSLDSKKEMSALATSVGIPVPNA